MADWGNHFRYLNSGTNERRGRDRRAALAKRPSPGRLILSHGSDWNRSSRHREGAAGNGDQARSRRDGIRFANRSRLHARDRHVAEEVSYAHCTHATSCLL